MAAERNREGNGNGNDSASDGALSRAVHDHAVVKEFAFDTKTDAVDGRFASSLGPLDKSVSELGEPERVEPPAPQDPTRGPTRAFFISLLIAQLGVEALGLAVPQLAGKLADSHQLAALLPAFSFGALTIGSLLGGPVVDKIGLRPAYLGMLVARVAAGTALAVTYGTGGLTFPLLTGLFAVDYLFLGASRVAESVLPTAIHGSAQGKVAGFGTIAQMVVESMGIVGLTAGALLLAQGFGPALALYPVVVAISGAIVWARLKPLAAEVKSGDPGVLASARAAISALRGSALMQRAVVGYGVITALVAWVYFTIGPKFHLVASSMSSDGGAFWISMMFAGGGLLATGVMAWRDSQATLAARGKRWLLGLGLALLSGFTLAMTPVWGIAAALAFMAVFGYTAAGAMVNLEALIKTEAPAAQRGAVMGIVRAAALLAAALSFPILGVLFDLMSPVAAYGAIAAVLAALGAGLLALRRGL